MNKKILNIMRLFSFLFIVSIVFYTSNPMVYASEEINNLMEEDIQKLEKKEKNIKKEREKSNDLRLIASCENMEEWYVEYRKICYKYAQWCDVPNNVYNDFSVEDVQFLCQVVETETYQQDFDSKVNIANVVFNRLDDGRFGDTIKDIVTAENQFAYYRESIATDTLIAVMYAYEMADTTDGALYFHSNKKTNKFNGANYLFTDEAGHHFYK